MKHFVTHQSRSHWLKNSGEEATGGSCPFRLSALTEVLERRHPEWALRTYIFTHREVHRENVRTERSICLQHAGTQGDSKQLNDRSWESWKIVDFLGGKLNDHSKGTTMFWLRTSECPLPFLSANTFPSPCQLTQWTRSHLMAVINIVSRKLCSE